LRRQACRQARGRDAAQQSRLAAGDLQARRSRAPALTASTVAYAGKTRQARHDTTGAEDSLIHFPLPALRAADSDLAADGGPLRRRKADRRVDCPNLLQAHAAIRNRPESQGDVSFVTVARSLEPLQIEMLRARLQAEGIMAFAIDAGINQVNALYSIAVGGVRLIVPRESADEARRILGLVRSGRFALRDGDDQH